MRIKVAFVRIIHKYWLRTLHYNSGMIEMYYLWVTRLSQINVKLKPSMFKNGAQIQGLLRDIDKSNTKIFAYKSQGGSTILLHIHVCSIVWMVLPCHALKTDEFTLVFEVFFTVIYSIGLNRNWLFILFLYSDACISRANLLHRYNRLFFSAINIQDIMTLYSEF